MQDKIKSLLEVAVYAPSGENSQPWRFELENNTLHVYNMPNKDNPIYNYHQRGSYVAHGALLENIKICSPLFGLEPVVKLFPNSTHTDLVASISFTGVPIVSEDNSLLSIIKKRSTNRKKYSNEKLDTELIQKLKDSVKKIDKCHPIFIEDVDLMKKISECVSIPDRVMLEYKQLHDTIFSNIRWNESENQKIKTGLFVKTMELAPPEEFIFRKLKHWPFARFATRLGLTKFISKENAKKYATGSLYVIFLVENIDQDYVSVGMAMQRMWLEVVQLGLSAHPLAALPYLYETVNNVADNDFSLEHREMINKAYDSLRNLCELPNTKRVGMVLRIGKAPSATANSPKLDPEIIVHT